MPAVQKDIKGLILQAGHHDIEPAIAIDVAKIRAHAGNGAPVAVIGHARIHPDLLQALAAIAQQQIAGVVVGNEKPRIAPGLPMGLLQGWRGYRCAHEIITSTILGTRNRQTAPPKFLPMASMSPPLNLIAAIPIKTIPNT